MSTLFTAPADPLGIAVAVVLLLHAKSDRVIGAVRAMLLSSSADSRSERHHYPSRNAFLEEPAMEREMRRL